jgi:hypothetical protein
MFSPEKIIYSLMDNNKKKLFVSLSWQKLFKEFFCTLYFQNHPSNENRVLSEIQFVLYVILS